MIAGPMDRIIPPHTVVWLHPEAPHAFEVIGDEPVAMFLIVSCNQVPSHTPPKDFIPGAEKIGMDVLSAKPGSKYVFEPFLRTEIVRLDPGQQYKVDSDPSHETITFVIRGQPHVTVGPLSGTYPAFGELFVPPGRTHTFENLTHDPVDLLVSRVNDDPGRPCIDTPFARGKISKRYKLPVPFGQ
jgi:quercetin dioxygenase-like cupin family protein